MTITAELADGTRMEFPDGTDPAVIQRVVKAHLQKTPEQENNARAMAARRGELPEITGDRAAQQAEIDRATEDQMILARDPMAMNALGKAVQGIPFVGQYADEAVGLLGGERAMQRAREQQDAMGRQYPKTSLGLQVAGGIAGGAPMAAAALPGLAASGGATLAGRAAAGALAGATAGAVEGAVSGAGAANDGNRLAGAGQGAMMGAAMGGAVGALAPVAAAGLKNALEFAKGRDTGIIARVLGVGKDAAKFIKSSVEADDFVAAERALGRSGPDAMLADAGPGFGQALDTAMQSSGAAARLGREAVEARAAAAGKRLNATFDAVLGKAAGLRDASKGIAQRTSGVRAQAYAKAYGSAIDYADGAGRAIEDVLQRVPSKTLGAAISEANDAMRAAGVRNLQIMAEIADDGAVTFREMPNVQQLDELKKALDGIARDATDPLTGKMTGAAVRASKLAADLREAVKNAVPDYARAVRLGGDKIAEDSALETGRKLLSPATTKETVRDAFANPSVAQKDAARRGLREYIDETLDNVKSVISDPNIDAREALKAVKDMSSKAAREKLAIVLGPSKANRLFDTLDEATAHLELRAAVARNSATASRQAGQETMRAARDPGAAGAAMRGDATGAFKKTVQLFTGATRERDLALDQQAYAEVARALTEKRGQAAKDALALVEKAIAGQPISTAEAVKIARAVTSGGAVGLYQTGMQSLSSPQYGQR